MGAEHDAYYNLAKRIDDAFFIFPLYIHAEIAYNIGMNVK